MVLPANQIKRFIAASALGRESIIKPDYFRRAEVVDMGRLMA